MLLLLFFFSFTILFFINNDDDVDNNNELRHPSSRAQHTHIQTYLAFIIIIIFFACWFYSVIIIIHNERERTQCVLIDLKRVCLCLCVCICDVKVLLVDPQCVRVYDQCVCMCMKSIIGAKEFMRKKSYIMPSYIKQKHTGLTDLNDKSYI